MKSIFSYEHPFVCTDAAIFTVNMQESDNYRKLPSANLNIMLYKRSKGPHQNKWCLPGGFLNIDELPENNIRRKLFEKVHVEHGYLEQLYTFCALDRDPRARVISISYLGLMNEDEAKKIKTESSWFKIQFLPEGRLKFLNGNILLEETDIGFDHLEIMKTALERLRSKILYSQIIFYLLPEKFTLTQLQNVYETILGKKEQAANFRRKITHMVQETEQYTSDKGHRPAKLFIKKNILEE